MIESQSASKRACCQHTNHIITLPEWLALEKGLI